MSAFQNFKRALLSGFIWGIGSVIVFTTAVVLFHIAYTRFGFDPQFYLKYVDLENTHISAKVLRATPIGVASICFMMGAGNAYGKVPDDKFGTFAILMIAAIIVTTTFIIPLLLSPKEQPISTESIVRLGMYWSGNFIVLSYFGLGRREHAIRTSSPPKPKDT